MRDAARQMTSTGTGTSIGQVQVQAQVQVGGMRACGADGIGRARASCNPIDGAAGRKPYLVSRLRCSLGSDSRASFSDLNPRFWAPLSGCLSEFTHLLASSPAHSCFWQYSHRQPQYPWPSSYRWQQAHIERAVHCCLLPEHLSSPTSESAFLSCLFSLSFLVALREAGSREAREEVLSIDTWVLSKTLLHPCITCA